MPKQVRAAGIAALLIFLAFAVHASNLFYFDPRMGFAKFSDYLSFPKIAIGLHSTYWLWDGYAHFVTGLSLLVLAAVGRGLFQAKRPLAARLLFATGIVAALPFLLAGICDVTGRLLLDLLEEANPGNANALYAVLALFGGVTNMLSIVLVGWFVLHFSWCLRQTGKVGILLGLLGYLTGLAAFSGFLWAGGYALAYLLLPAWTLWLGVEFITAPATIAFDEEY